MLMVTLGPLNTSLVSLFLSLSKKCLFLCLDIFHIHHTNLPPPQQCFYFDLTPQLTSTNLSLTYSIFSLSLTLSFCLFNLVALLFSLLTSCLIFSRFTVRIIQCSQFSSFSYSLLSFLCMFDVSFCYHPVLYLLIFYSFFSHFHVEMLHLHHLPLLLHFISLTIKCKELNSCHLID